MRQSIRVWSRRRGVAAALVLSLAGGIAGASTVFSFVDAFGLRPPSVSNPERLVRVFTSTRELAEGSSSYPDYRDLAGGAPAVSALAAYGRRVAAIRVLDASDVVPVQVVTANYFDTLGVRPFAGRFFGAADGPDAAPTVVLGYRLWTRRFNRDPAVVGRAVAIDAKPCTVIGVAPKEFGGLEPQLFVDAWLSLSAWAQLGGGRRELEDRGSRWFTIVGRLRDGETVEAARAQAAGMMATLAREYPKTNEGRGATATAEMRIRRRGVAVLGPLLLAAVALVLLLSWANAAGLLMGRAIERRREMGTRVALGASRGRLVRQLAVENGLIAAAAGIAGLLSSWWLIGALPALMPNTPVPLGFDFRFDTRVIAFAIALSILTAAGFGLAPALATAHVTPGGVLRPDEGRAGRPLRMRRLLVVVQLALSLVLLVGAALVAGSFRALSSIDPGFSTAPGLLMTMSPGAVDYPASKARAFFAALTDRVRALPQVERVALARRFPLSFAGGAASQEVRIGGRAAPESEPIRVKYNDVDAAYFETAGVRILRGRAFTAHDDRASPPVAIVSATMAHRCWPAADPIGRHLRLSGSTIDHEIIGIAADGKYTDVTEAPEPFFYLPLAQRNPGEATLIVRTSGDERAVVASVRAALADVDPNVPALQVMTMTDHLRLAMYAPRLMAILAAVLAAIGLGLAVIGLYGITAYSVRQQTREIGIRLALGAEPRHVLWRVAAGALRLVGAGAVLGALAAALAARGLTPFLYGVSPYSARAFAVPAAILVATAALATFIPARHATRVDPAAALRSE